MKIAGAALIIAVWGTFKAMQFSRALPSGTETRKAKMDPEEEALVRRYTEDIPEPPPGRYLAHKVEVVDPEHGIVVPFIFDAESWKMLHVLAQVEKKDVEEILIEFAAEATNPPEE